MDLLSFNATTFTVFGIPPYVFFVGVGAVFAFFIFNCLLLFLKADIKLGNRVVIFSIPALLLGAKSFGVIANIVECIMNNSSIDIDTFIYSGIVFYGGLIFFLISFWLLIHKSPLQDKVKITDSLATSIPLFHAFGRIGCFTAGCCYGVPTNCIIGVTYTTWIQGSVSTATRVPIQLIEAIVNIILFALLLQLVLNKKATGKLLILYILNYSIVRFIDEFFRGDIDKNILSGFSAAQLISAVLIVFVSIKLITERKQKNVQSR